MAQFKDDNPALTEAALMIKDGLISLDAIEERTQIIDHTVNGRDARTFMVEIDGILYHVYVTGLADHLDF